MILESRYRSASPLFKIIILIACLALLIAIACLTLIALISLDSESRECLKVTGIERSNQPKGKIAPLLSKGKACSRSGNCLDNILLIHGLINNSIAAKFNSIDLSTYNAICFNAKGGDSPSAEIVGRKIYSQNANTCLADIYIVDHQPIETQTICGSACPLVFRMGNERVLLGSEPKIAIHSSGGKIEFGGLALHMNEFWFSPESTLRYQRMLKLKTSSTEPTALKLLERSNETCFWDFEALDPTGPILNLLNMFTEIRK